MKLNIVQKFTILSVVATAVVIVGLSILVSHIVTAGMLRDEGRITAETLRTVTAVDLPPEQFQRATRNQNWYVFMYIWSHLRRIPDVYKMWVYDTDGRMVWSDDMWVYDERGRRVLSDQARLLAGRPEASEAVAEALQGRTRVRFGRADDPQEYQAGLAEGEAFLEIYVPLLSPEDKSPYAVVALCERPGRFLAGRRRLVLMVWLAGTAGGLALFLLLNGFFRRALSEQIRLRDVEKEMEAVRLDLKLAGEIQRKLMPGELPEVPGCSLAAWHEPSQEVGGDYYDVFTTPDGAVVLIVADSDGQGMAGALVAAEVRHHVRAEAGVLSDAAAALASVDRLLRERPAPSRAVSCAYARFDPGSGTLRFCGAGTCVALLAGRREVTVLQSGGGALGRGEGASLDEQVVAMEPGDRLVLYTDGVPKSEGPGGETLGAVRIEAVLRARTAPYSAQDLVEAIRGDIAEFTEGAPPPDDRTLVCLVVDGVPPEGQG